MRSLLVILIAIVLGATELFAQTDLALDTASNSVFNSNEPEGSQESAFSEAESLNIVSQIQPRVASIEQLWSSIVDSIAERDFKLLSDELSELNRLRYELGIEVLEPYSLYMIDQARKLAAKKEYDLAGFLVRKALELSIISPRVLWEIYPLMSYAGLDFGTLGWIKRIITSSWTYPTLALSLLKRLIYPVLWSLTIALYLVIALYISYQIRDLLKIYAAFFPALIRGIVAPLLALLVLLVPISFGPLWCLFSWAFFALALLPAQRWLGFWVGALFVLWGSLIPIRETLNYWLNDKNFSTMLDVASGFYRGNVESSLDQLITQNPNQGAIYYVRGQYLRGVGKLEQARQSLLRAEMLLGRQGYTKAERALLEYQAGNSSAADELFDQSRSLGLRSTALFLNHSKIKFDLMDTESSKELLALAQRKDRELLNLFRSREELLGQGNRKAVLSIALPFTNLLGAALKPNSEAFKRIDQVSSALMPGSDPIFIMMLGGLILLRFMFKGKQRKGFKFLAYYPDYRASNLLLTLMRATPGGIWLLVNKPAWSFVVISALTLLIMPLLGWPNSDMFIIEYEHQFFWSYVGAIVFLALSNFVYNLSRKKER